MFFSDFKDSIIGENGLFPVLVQLVLPAILVMALLGFGVRAAVDMLELGIFLRLLDGWFFGSASLVIFCCVSLNRGLAISVEQRLLRWPLWLFFHLIMACAMITIALVVSGFIRWRTIQMMSGLG